ncbi:fibronectin type III domain-containing protein [Bacillus toyonensis]|uniref:fibronectin type III domain-containing protein n=1 Tax=Bacillus toyonensis TaxID=155322 RepID=UPI00211E6C21|nr:fibronectin type III domain-containing protein [Bacillus toyonensis]
MFTVMFILSLSVLPSFASAEVKDILKGKQGYNDLSFTTSRDLKGERFVNLTDSGSYTSNYFSISKDRPTKVFFDLGSSQSVSNIYLRVVGGTTVDNYKPEANFTFYDSDKKVIKTEKKLLTASSLQFDFPVSVEKARYVSLVFIGTVTSDYDLQVYDFGVHSFTFSEVEQLVAIEGVNDVNFTWKNPIDKEFTGVKILKDGKELITLTTNTNSYKVQGLDANKNYNFGFVALYGDKQSLGIQKGVKTLIDPKTIPPGSVSSLTAEPTDKTVKLKWKSPKDDDLAGFKILQNGKQVAEIGLEEEFTVKNLQSLTDYTFGVMAVDTDKNDSTPVNLSVKTLEENDDEPPLVPSNVFAKPSNGALIASWDKVSDKDLAGYNVYVDGKKINSNLISSTNFTIRNLENDRKYKVQVQAVDRSGNASELSSPVFGTPDMNTIPLVESKYNLQDVSDGVGNQFWQLWPFLAWYLGIPLSFYVIYKFKQVYLP